MQTLLPQRTPFLQFTRWSTHRGGWAIRDVILAALAIGLMSAIATPWLLDVREASRTATCRAHLRALTTGLRDYHDMHAQFPPAAVWSTDATVTLALHSSKQVDLITHENWAQLILPHVGFEDLQRQFVPSAPIGAESNAAARTTSIDVMTCPVDDFNHDGNRYTQTTSPDDPHPVEFARGNYAINGGTHNYQYEPPSTDSSRGDTVHLLMQDAPRRYELWGNGVAGINHSFKMDDFQNGASTLVALEELRAGLHPVDPRGVWSLGQIGGSITWGHGVSSDAFGPNHQWPRSDDVLGCGELHEVLGTDVIMAERMPCVDYVNANQQATSRSLHPGGVYVSFLDASVRFISDSVDPGLWHVMHSRETPASVLSHLDKDLSVEDYPNAPAPSIPAAASLAVPTPFRNSVGMTLQPIPPGEFRMGTPDLGNDADPPADCPAHDVRLTRGFLISTCEVTRGQFRTVLGRDSERVDGGLPDAADDLPVTGVTWHEADEFCRWLSSLEPGRHYRLPTEAEWEYCCRGGTSDPYDWSGKRSRTAGDQSGEAAGINPPLPLTPVGSHPPNALGLHDMRGNAWEWTADWFDRDYYSRSPVDNPQGPAAGFVKVVRGGDWRFIGENCRIDYPMLPPWKSNPMVGFRVACDIAREPPQATASNHQ